MTNKQTYRDKNELQLETVSRNSTVQNYTAFEKTEDSLCSWLVSNNAHSAICTVEVLPLTLFC